MSGVPTDPSQLREALAIQEDLEKDWKDFEKDPGKKKDPGDLVEN